MTMMRKAMPDERKGPALRERIEEFGDRLDDVIRRDEYLRLVSDSSQGGHFVAAAQDQLRLQHEELLVANEELNAQMTELDEVAQRLNGERKRHSELFAFVPDPLFYTDRPGTIREANRAACEMLGIEYRFLIGKPLAVFVDRSDVARYRELSDRIASGVALERRLMMKARDGATEEVLLRGQVLDNRHHVAWVARRVDTATDERASQPPPSAHSASSDRFVAVREDRTDELAAELHKRDEQLESERRRSASLQNESAAKDRSIAMVSHELRGPINVVLGWTDLLRSGSLDESQRERALLVIERNARAQAALVEDLMDVSRIVAGSLALRLEQLDLSALVGFTAEAVEVEARARGIRLLARVEPGLTMDGDRGRLTQVLMNLVSNALKFTRAEGRVEVSLAKRGAVLVLEVRDTGAGIAADQLPHVFDCFHQAGDSGSRALGMGLGLFLVKELVELHGGSTGAFSEGLGHGTTIRVSLPIHSVAADTPRGSS